MLRTDPPPGVAAWLVDEADLSRFHASKCVLRVVVVRWEKKYRGKASV